MGSGIESPPVVETYLSRAPGKNGVYAAFVSISLFFLVSAVYWENWQNYAHLLPAIPTKVFDQGEYWRLLSGMFTHSDLGHLLSNAFTFGIFCVLLYGYFGSPLYPFWCWIVGIISNAVTLVTYPPETHLVGASGLAYQMTGTWLALYAGIDTRFSIPIRLLRCLGFCFVILIPTTFEQNISYRAHAIGFAFGIALGLWFFWTKRQDFRLHEVVKPDDPDEDPAGLM